MQIPCRKNPGHSAMQSAGRGIACWGDVLFQLEQGDGGDPTDPVVRCLALRCSLLEGVWRVMMCCPHSTSARWCCWPLLTRWRDGQHCWVCRKGFRTLMMWCPLSASPTPRWRCWSPLTAWWWDGKQLGGVYRKGCTEWWCDVLFQLQQGDGVNSCWPGAEMVKNLAGSVGRGIGHLCVFHFQLYLGDGVDQRWPPGGEMVGSLWMGV